MLTDHGQCLPGPAAATWGRRHRSFDKGPYSITAAPPTDASRDIPIGERSDISVGDLHQLGVEVGGHVIRRDGKRLTLCFRSCIRPRNRRRAHVVTAPDLGKRLFAPVAELPFLTWNTRFTAVVGENKPRPLICVNLGFGRQLAAKPLHRSIGESRREISGRPRTDTRRRRSSSARATSSSIWSNGRNLWSLSSLNCAAAASNCSLESRFTSNV